MVSLENEDSVEVVSKSLDKAFLGHSFLFGFKSHISTPRINRSTSSPITLAHILHGGKLLQSRRRYQDRTNLIAVLMLSPYTESFPTVAYHIYVSNNSLKPLNVSPCENNSPAKEDEIDANQCSFKSSMTNENTKVDSETGSFSNDSLQFSYEETCSEQNKTNASNVQRDSSEILKTKSAECISDYAPRSTFALQLDDKDHHTIQQTQSDLCQYMQNSFHISKTSPACSTELSGNLTNVSKSLLPQCLSPRTKTLAAGKEMLRNLEINSVCNSSGSSDGELSERRKEKKSCSLPKLTTARNIKISPDNYTPNAIVDNPDLMEQLFDDNESWLQFKNSKADSKIQEDTDIPDSENIEVLNNVFKDENSFDHGHCSTTDGHKGYTSSQIKGDQCLNETFAEFTRENLPDSEDFPESEDLDAFLKKASSHNQSRERVFPTIANSSQLLSSKNCKGELSNKINFGVCHSLNNCAVSTEICSRKVIHKKPLQRKLSYSTEHKPAISITDNGEQLQSVSTDSKEQSLQDIDPLKNSEDKLFDKIHHSIRDTECIANITNKYVEFNTENGKDCKIIINKTHTPNYEQVREQKRRKRKSLCKTFQEKFIQKYSNKLSNTCSSNMNASKAKPVPDSLKCSGLPVKSKAQNRQSLVNLITDIERKTKILDLLKVDCEMKRVEILLDLKCQSLQNNPEYMAERSDTVTSISETKPFLYSSTKELQTLEQNAIDDKPKSISTHHFRNKKKQTSEVKLDSPSSKVSLNPANRPKGKVMTTIKGYRCKRSPDTEPCASTSLESGVYFNSQKITLHKRTNRKYYQNLSGSVLKTASVNFNPMVSTDHNTIDTSGIENVSGPSNSEACDDMNEIKSTDHVCTLDTHSPKDLREDYGSNCNTNRSNNEESDNENCSAKIDILLEDRISLPNVNSEPLFSDNDESVLKSGYFQKGSMQNPLSLFTDQTEDRKASANHYTSSHSNTSFSNYNNGSADLFDISEHGRNIYDRFINSSTPTKCFNNCIVDALHVSSSSRYRTDELDDSETDRNNYSKLASGKSVRCANNESEYTSPAGVLLKRHIGDYLDTPMSNKSRRVQFSKRLSHVSTTSVIDMQMQRTSSPAGAVKNTSNLKSCLKKSETGIGTSAYGVLAFSQDLFSPSPIFNNSIKRNKADSAKYQPKGTLPYARNDPESIYAKYANRNNNCMLESSFGIDSYCYQYANADSPLLFSANKMVSSAPRDAKSFLSMCEDKVASPRIGSQDRSSLLLTPDLFSP